MFEFVADSRVTVAQRAERGRDMTTRVIEVLLKSIGEKYM
jgi:hypothetical protein